VYSPRLEDTLANQVPAIEKSKLRTRGLSIQESQVYQFLIDDHGDATSNLSKDTIRKDFKYQKTKMGLDYLKKENTRLKNLLSSSKTFMNMVIHDLRNPTSQIKFTIE